MVWAGDERAGGPSGLVDRRQPPGVSRGQRLQERDLGDAADPRAAEVRRDVESAQGEVLEHLDDAGWPGARPFGLTDGRRQLLLGEPGCRVAQADDLLGQRERSQSTPSWRSRSTSPSESPTRR